MAYPTVAAGYAVLLASGIWHMRRVGSTREVLATQGLPRWAVQPVAVSLAPAELVVGLTGLLTVGRPTSAVPVVAGLLLLLFTGWAALVRAARPGTDCGCGAGAGPVTLGTMIRAGLLAAGVLVPSQVRLDGMDSFDTFGWVLSMSAWAVLTSCLPAALASSDHEMGIA